MNTHLHSKKFLVTGASGAIGAATARLFAAEGAELALHYNRNRTPLSELAASLPVRSVLVQADLKEEAEVDGMFGTLEEDLGPLDGIVVNAGIWEPTEVPLHEMSLAQWHQTQATNLTSAFLTCRGYLRQVARTRPNDASIVLVGSTAALFGEENHADYSAAKAGLSYGLTLTLKNEIVRLSPRGRVNCVCPGWVATPMSADALNDPTQVGRATATMPLRKVATVDDVAAAIVFLSSDALAGHLSGTLLPIAGGMEGRMIHHP